MSRLKHFLDSQPTNGDRLSALRARPSFPPGSFLVLIFVRGRVDSKTTVRLEGLDQLQNPMTSWGIGRATFRLVS
jgi:hypothetical protein